MTKDMTPMKRYSINMQELRSHLKPFFSELTLNKSKPKNYYAGGVSSDNAGVESDFILIFSDKTKNVSFALSFTYIDLDVSQQTVQASVKSSKSNDDIESSESMTLDEFKVKINSFNKWLVENNVKHSKTTRPPLDIIDKFADVFMDKKLDVKKEVEKKEKEIADFIIEKSKDLNVAHLTEKSMKANHSFDNVNTLIKTQIESSPEFKELQTIEKRAKELRKIIDKSETKLQKDMDVEGLLYKKQDAATILRQARYSLESCVQDELKKSSKVIAKKVKPKY